MIALAAGCLTYVVLLNPLTYESRALYPYLTASLPAAATRRRAGMASVPLRRYSAVMNLANLAL